MNSANDPNPAPGTEVVDPKGKAPLTLVTPGMPLSAPVPKPTSAGSTDDDPGAKKQKKKKDKARSAWISFVGRIVAQIVGALTAILLGFYVVGKGIKESKYDARGAAAPVVHPVRTAGAEPTIAVLPLQNFSGEKSQEYFVEGMTEAVIADLAQVKGLRVISRTSSMLYKSGTKSVPEIGAELGVDYIVEGSIAKGGDRIRITAQLIDAKRDEHLWARSYERKVHDLLALQGEVSAAIAAEVSCADACAENTSLGTAVGRSHRPRLTPVRAGIDGRSLAP